MGDNKLKHSQKDNPSKDDHSTAEMFASIALLGIGAYLLDKFGWVACVLPWAGAFILAVRVQSASSPQSLGVKKSLEFRKRCEELGLSYKWNMSNVVTQMFIGDSEENYTLLIEVPTPNNRTARRLIDIRKVLDVDLSIFQSINEGEM